MEVNTKRLIELDFIKAVAIILMILVHTFEEFGSYSLQSGSLNYIVRLLGGPFVAPSFMFAMGIGLLYSKKTDPKQLFTRGIFLFSIGYLLQLTREIPRFILGFSQNNPGLIKEGLLYTIGLDIMIFAGLFFMFFALYKKLKLKDYWLIIFYIIFTALNHLLANVHFSNIWLNFLSGHFWGSWENTWFPFFSWYIYPIAGYFIGGLIKKDIDNKDLFFKKLLLCSFTALIVFGYLFKNVDFGIQSSFYSSYFQQRLEGNLFYLSLTLTWFSLGYFIIDYLPQKLKELITIWSIHLNKRYIIHWIILALLLFIFPPHSQGLYTILGMYLFVLISSDYLSQKTF